MTGCQKTRKLAEVCKGGERHVHGQSDSGKACGRYGVRFQGVGEIAPRIRHESILVCSGDGWVKKLD